MAYRRREAASSACAPKSIKNKFRVNQRCCCGCHVRSIHRWRSILLPGIAGFIGSSIAHELVQPRRKVRGLDDFSTGKWENIADIKDDLDFREVSLLDPAGLASACEGIDYVFHQAALPSVPKSVAEPELTHAVNVNGTLNLLLAARDAGVKRVVYAASSSAYGESEVLPKREDMLPRPISPYAVQKLTGEYYMQTFPRCTGWRR